MDISSVAPSFSLRYSKSLARLSIGLVIGGVCLWMALHGLSLSHIRSALQQASFTWMLISVACVVAVALAKAARWQTLYRAEQNQPAFGELFTVLMMAQMINLVIPIRLGELLRIGLMKQAGQPGPATFSTLVAEKTLDLLAAGLVATALIVLAAAPDWLHEQGISLLLISLTLAAGLGLSWWWREVLEQNLARLLGVGNILAERWQMYLLHGARTLLRSLSTLTHRATLTWIVFWTINIWLLSLLTILALFTAFGLHLPVAAAVILMLAVSVSNIAPSPPALVGVMPFLAVLILGQYGVVQSQAATFGLVLNVITVGPLIILGGWGLWGRTLSLLDCLDKSSTDDLVKE